MPQGSLKTKPKPPKPSSSSSKHAGPAPKKGRNSAIAPRKQALIKQRKITKRISAGLTARTERLLAERVGHLEVLGGKQEKRK